MFTLPMLLRYIMYIAAATLLSKLFPEFDRTFLLVCGILAEVLDWKYNYTESEG